MTEVLRVAGLFAGIGGLDLGIAEGLAEGGIATEHTALVEWEAFPQKVLAVRFPEARLFSDVRDVKGSDLGNPDILVGGFPCQDVSIAKRDPAGLAGSRSGLWSEQCRLISETGVGFAVIENVSELLRRGLWRVLKDLHKIGYVAQYDVLTAKSVGAPHQRERVFVVAQRREIFDGTLLAFEPYDMGQWSSPYPYPWAENPPAVLDAVKALGNAVVPPVAAVVGRALKNLSAVTTRMPPGAGVVIDESTPMPRAGFMDLDGRLHAVPSSTRRAKADEQLDEALELKGTRQDRERELAARIAARRLPTPTATDWKGGGVGGAWHRNLKQGMGGTPSPAFLEWVMGFPADWTDV